MINTETATLTELLSESGEITTTLDEENFLFTGTVTDCGDNISGYEEAVAAVLAERD